MSSLILQVSSPIVSLKAKKAGLLAVAPSASAAETFYVPARAGLSPEKVQEQLLLPPRTPADR